MKNAGKFDNVCYETETKQELDDKDDNQEHPSAIN